MYICNFCSRTFIEGSPRGGVDEPRYFVCPFCGDDEISDAEECAMCGTIYPEEKLAGGLCAKCEADTQRQWEEMRMALSPPQREYLDWYMEHEGIWFDNEG